MNKQKGLWLTIVCLCAALSTVSSAAERVVEKIFPVEEGAIFSINSHRGHVQIRTADVDTIQVIATISHQNRDVLDRVEIVTHNSSRRVEVDVEYERDAQVFRFWWQSTDSFPRVSFEVVLPTSVSLRVDSHRSSLNIEAPEGDVSIKSHRGSGNVFGIKGEFTLDTHRGDFDIEVDELHDIDIKTHRGDVRVDIAHAENFSIDGKAHRGRLRFYGKDLRVFEVSGRETIVSDMFGTGEKQINIDSHRGDVSFDFIN